MINNLPQWGKNLRPSDLKKEVQFFPDYLDGNLESNRQFYYRMSQSSEDHLHLLL